MQRSASSGTGQGGFKPGHRSKNSITSLRDHGGLNSYSDHHVKSPLSREVLSTSEPQDLTKESSGTAPPISTSLPHDAPSAGNSSSHGTDNSDSTHGSHGRESESMKEPPAVPAKPEAGEGHQQQPQPPSTLPPEPTSVLGVDNKQVQKKQTLQQMRGLPDLYLADVSGSATTTVQDNSRSNHSNRSQHQHQHHHHHHHHQDINAMQEPLIRPPEPRSRVAMLQPFLAVAIHQEPLASITFREDAIMTSDRRGHIKVWKRPSNPPVSGTAGP